MIIFSLSQFLQFLCTHLVTMSTFVTFEKVDHREIISTTVGTFLDHPKIKSENYFTATTSFFT